MSPWRPLLWPGIAAGIALAILVSLGFWQLGRRVEKEAQLASLRAATSSLPMALPAGGLNRVVVGPAGAVASAANQWSELSRVEIRGQFIGDRVVPVSVTLPQTKDAPVSGIGFFWMAPLQIETGEIVFINRGFAPAGANWKPPPLPMPAGSRTVVGLLRAPERAGWLTPSDSAEKSLFHVRDPARMAAVLGLDTAKVAPFFIDAERQPSTVSPPVGVVPSELIGRIRNNHLQYAVTWFGFAATLIVIFGVFARQRLRESQP